MDYATFIGEKVKSVAPLGFEPDPKLVKMRKRLDDAER